MQLSQASCYFYIITSRPTIQQYLFAVVYKVPYPTPLDEGKDVYQVSWEEYHVVQKERECLAVEKNITLTWKKGKAISSSLEY